VGIKGIDGSRGGLTFLAVTFLFFVRFSSNNWENKAEKELYMMRAVA